MKPPTKYILWLCFFEFLIIITGYVLTSEFKTGPEFSEVVFLSASFALMALVTILIFFSGQKKDPEGQTIHILIALGLKFIADLVIALIWFFVAKKTGPAAVILFFVLYLAFTLFSILVVLKTLKYKPL